eukprot:Tamp_03527.p2 GENE.Tamp_03527~~Tamp_03527.p2  ORF type:complete len:245 (+),score=76.89 Tamp_03527:2276-3010(+)
MVKVVLENKEALSAIEDRIQKAVDYVLESNPKLRSGERKLMRNKLTQLTSCLTLKIKRNTRLRDEEWSDIEEDEREAKVAKTEHLEPEDKALKARVESLKRQVKDTATRVRAQRTTVPAEMKQQVHASLQQAAAALEASLVPSSSEQPAASQPKTPVTISKAVGAAFVHDTVDLARRSALLRKSLPEQVTRGKAAVKVCTEWSRKPLTSAEALLAERPAASSKSPGPARRKGAVVHALAGRQAH